MNLLDAVCLRLSGWKTEDEHALYVQAHEVVSNHALTLKLEAKVKLAQHELTEHRDSHDIPTTQ